ncbi:MAG: hypothetical protein LBB98_01775 [Treponema sp.]|nr:hypothetical protein [Treponema sp.]
MSSYQRYAITYLHTLGGWVSLTVVVDLYDRKVIGWVFSGDMETVHTTIPAGDGVCQPEGPGGPDIPLGPGGGQYCAKAFRNQLQELCPSVRQSMSRKGNCWDNACAESLFKPLKREQETVDGKDIAGEPGAYRAFYGPFEPLICVFAPSFLGSLVISQRTGT